ncbi:hypothetical protein ACFU6K_16315 [Kitasatospora sp. NPDC057512]|uniref:hypothetical protein n=1 Tax=Kitasatospora sp. NPDC057512 TaxID=3346154 RepID=UPI0036A12CF9
MPTIKVVDITPKAQSGDANQDCEPNLAVNPENPLEMVATAFTPDPLNGPFAPVYVSTDGGDTWVLKSIVPGNDGIGGTGDISVGFAAHGGRLYTGILNGTTSDLEILRKTDVTAPGPMEVLVDVPVRAIPDQPWVVTGPASANGGGRDVVYVGNNVTTRGAGSATVTVSADASTGTGGFSDVKVDQRPGAKSNGPPVRLAAHADGTVYGAFESYNSIVQDAADPKPAFFVNLDVVVTRDDRGGLGPKPFEDLRDAADGAVGQRVVSHRALEFKIREATLGQERTGADLSIAVDPTDSASVWVAWCDVTGGLLPTDYVLHVRHSTDRGQTWAQAHQDLVDAKNPSLAITSDGLVGLVYQQLAHGQWSTVLELSSDGFKTAESTVLHQAPGDVPVSSGVPYLGDYIRMLAVGKDFYGIFAGNNTPDRANFPVGVTYQRNANFTTHQLLSSDGVTRVPPSIDPFFFHRAA